MNGLKTDDYRYWITYLLDDLKVGSNFKPGLLHITVIPWFVLEIDERRLLEAFRMLFLETKTFEVEIGTLAMFGPNKEVAVNLLRDPKEFLSLHSLAIDWFNEIGARWAVKHPHVEQEYKPHIRKREQPSLEEGQKLLINRLELVRARRHEDEIRTLAAKVNFE